MSSSRKKSSSDAQPWIKEKILVLAVDIDDDLGQSGIETPVVGHDNVVEKLIEFGKRRPDDSDVNAILAAISIYERLRGEGRDVEIAVLSGDPSDIVKAMFRIEHGLRTLKEKIGYTHIFLISDGLSDERVLPLLTNYGIVLGVERVIVQQSHGIEESFILFTRYLKKAVNEQPYARYFLGIPGFLILVASAMSLMGLIQYLTPVLSILIGTVMVMKGFGVIAWSRRMWEASPLVFLSFLFGMLMYGLAVIAATYIFYTQGLTVSSVTAVIDTSVQLLVLGSVVLIMGRIIYRVLSSSAESIWMESIWIIPLVFIVLILRRISDKVTRLPGNATSTDISRAMTSADVLGIMLLGIAVSVAVVLAFMFIEKRISAQISSHGAGSS